MKLTETTLGIQLAGLEPVLVCSVVTATPFGDVAAAGRLDRRPPLTAPPRRSSTNDLPTTPSLTDGREGRIENA
jgi:hypothetical protein